MDNNNKNTSITLSGLLAGLLTIVFVVLKLCKVIDWSWWWVLSPLWISFAIDLIVILVVFIIISIVGK